MRHNVNVLLSALLALSVIIAGCADDDGALPPTGPEPPCGCPNDPDPDPDPDPTPSSDIEVVFHSLTSNFDTPGFYGDEDGVTSEIVLRYANGDTVRHQGGLYVADGDRLYFATTAFTGTDFNLAVANRNGTNVRQVGFGSFDAHGNVSDIDAKDGTLAIVAEMRSNEFDPTLEIGIGAPGALAQLPHRGAVQSESVVLTSTHVLTNLQLANGEQPVRIARNGSSEEAVGDGLDTRANANVEGVLGDWVIKLGENIFPGVPENEPYVVATNRVTGQMVTLSRKDADDAVVCGGLIGVTYSSAAAPAGALVLSAETRRLVLNDEGFVPDNIIEWRRIDGTIVKTTEYDDAEGNDLPVIDPSCSSE